jgi:hydrogenase expression/formation protein HypE
MSGRENSLHCPTTQLTHPDLISLTVGEGAKASRDFLDRFIYSRFKGASLSERSDAGSMTCDIHQLAFTTDSFVVDPYFFTGGDIGKLAVCGTINDLCMVGALPRWISLSLILEEGFPCRDLVTILDSVCEWSERANVEVVCGDTKVIPKGKMDGIFINTSGIGVRRQAATLLSHPIDDGDVIIVSGPIGCHGMAVMAARNQGLVENPIESDCGLLLPVLHALIENDIPVKAMRDATRGGVAAVLHEWAHHWKISISIEERHIPVRDDVRGLTELLGLDPLFVANEGAMVLIVSSKDSEVTLAAMRSVTISQHAVVIGKVVKQRHAPVSMVRGIGREVALHEPTGALLPRIC